MQHQLAALTPAAPTEKQKATGFELPEAIFCREDPSRSSQPAFQHDSKQSGR